MYQDPSKIIKKKRKPKLEQLENIKLVLTFIQGIGPKTSDKMIEAGYDTVEKVMEASSEEMAEAVSGLSVSKAKSVIEETKEIKEQVEAAKLDLKKARRGRRRKVVDEEPDSYGLPPAGAIEHEIERTNLKTGHEKDNERLGIPIGPKWLTRFEKARVIGARALQISMGAPTLLSMDKGPAELFAFAEMELRAGVLPMTVRRSAPTGEIADIALSVLLGHTRLD